MHSVCAPHTRCEKLQQMAVRIAKVDTPASSGPGDPAQNVESMSI